MNQINDWQRAVEIVSERTANYETVNDYIEEKTGQSGNMQELIPYLVRIWMDAPTIAAKNNICRSEIIGHFETPTTRSMFSKLYFEHVTVTVLEILMLERYDTDMTGRHENINIADDIYLIVGIEPIL